MNDLEMDLILARAETESLKKRLAGHASENMNGGNNMGNLKEQYYIVRCDRAGVFAGHIRERNGREVKLANARRLWYWDGAASLSQMAVDGVKKPRNCKFTVTVPEIIVLDVIEILACSDKAERSIREVPEWKV